jgi:hypothetical protein
MFSHLSLSLTNVIRTNLAADSLDLLDRQLDSGQLLQGPGSVLITSQIGPRPDNLFQEQRRHVLTGRALQFGRYREKKPGGNAGNNSVVPDIPDPLGSPAGSEARDPGQRDIRVDSPDNDGRPSR